MEDNNYHEKSNEAFYNKWWFWLIIAIIVLLIVGTIAGIVSGDNSIENSATDISRRNYYIGDKVQSGNIEFTADRVYDTKILGSSLLGQETMDNFVVVELTIKNIGNSEITLTSSDFKLKRGSASYEITAGSIYLDNGFYVLEKVGAGITKKIVIAFETPLESSSIYTLTVKDGLYSLEKEIILKQID